MQPPPVPTIGHQVRWSEQDPLPTQHARRLSFRLRELVMHNGKERFWNRQLSNALEAPFEAEVDINIAQETEMCNGPGDIWALGPEEPIFTDMTLQRKMREVVQKKRKRAKPNSQVGMYVPDFCTSIGIPYPGGLPTYHVASLVGEVKVTRVERRGPKWVVALDPEDDPELGQLFDTSTHWTLPTPDENSTIAEVAAADIKKKWKLGVSKTLIYLTTLFEWSGGFLAFVIIGSRFSRLIALGQRHVLIETAGEERTFTLPEYVNGDVDLPWDLAIAVGAPPTVASPVVEAAQVNRQSYDRLMDVVRLSVQVLASQPLRPPFRRIELPDSSSTPTLTEIRRRVMDPKATELSWAADSDEAVVVASREDLWGRQDRALARGSSPHPPQERDDDDENQSDNGEADGDARQDQVGGQKRERDGDEASADKAAGQRVTRARGATDMISATSGAPLVPPPDLVSSERGSPPSSPVREPATPLSPSIPLSAPSDAATFSSRPPTVQSSPSPVPCFTLPEYAHVSRDEYQRLLDTGEYFPVGRTDMLRLINEPQYQQASDTDMLELALGLGDITVTAVPTSTFDTCLHELSAAVAATPVG